MGNALNDNQQHLNSENTARNFAGGQTQLDMVNGYGPG